MGSEFESQKMLSVSRIPVIATLSQIVFTKIGYIFPNRH